MHRSTTKPLIVAAIMTPLLVAAIGVSCNRPSPPPTLTPTSIAASTLTPSSPQHTATPMSTPAPPIVWPTSTYLATAVTATWTAIPTATMAATATIATNAPTTPPETPTAVIVQPHTGSPHAGDSAPLTGLYVIAGLLIILYGILFGKFRRRE